MRVRDLLAMRSFDLRVLAGQDQLDDTIRWVHVTDLPDPSPYLRGGELILTSALWHGTADDSERFVTALVSSGVRALGVAIRGGGEIPDDVVDACREHDLPLLAVPDGPFMDLTEAVIAALMEERGQTSVRSVRVEQDLTARLARGEGPDALAEILAGAVEAPCSVIDRRGSLLAHAGDAAPTCSDVQRAWRAWSQHVGDSRTLETSFADGSPGTLVTASDRHAILYGAPLGHIRLREQLAVGIPENYLRLSANQHEDRHSTAVTLLGEAIVRMGEPLPNYEQITRILDALGLESCASLAFIVASRRDHLETDRLTDGVEAGVRFAGHVPVATATVERHVVTLVSVGRAWVESEVGAQAAASARDLSGSTTSIGVSAAKDAVDALPSAILRARQACLLSEVAEGDRAWASHAEVGSHSLLLDAAHQGLHDAFRATLLVPLEEYDAANGGHLVETLRVFLDTACSWTRSAEQLFVHVNTLRYRIAQVEQLTGRSLSSMGDRVDLYLALRTRVQPRAFDMGHHP